MNPYDLPHISERAETIDKLNLLDRKQRQIARSYTHNVEFGSIKIGDWFGPDTISDTAWRKPFSRGGRFYGTERDGNPAFREALAALKAAYLAHEDLEEQRAIHAASRKLRLAAPKAADALIDLVDNAQNETVRRQAAEAVLDRASAETGSKSETLTITTDLDDWRKEAARRRAAVDNLMREWDEETTAE